ncbi:MAG: sigma-70 family RNA polymerase sigma factor [Verrucomicrobia bacterium]|nr:sigma-70 family RNA polymerase sigma factor [Verrucomicrobiota bacterium]
MGGGDRMKLMSVDVTKEIDLENGPTDEELVAETVKGNLASYDELIRRFQSRLYGVIYHLTSNHEDTNDMLMEVFDKAYRSLPTFRGQSSFYTWIYRIAINRTFNFLEKRKRRQGAMSLNEIDEDGLPKYDMPDPIQRNNPSKSSMLNELQNKLNESMLGLSKEQRPKVRSVRGSIMLTNSFRNRLAFTCEGKK